MLSNFPGEFKHNHLLTPHFRHSWHFISLTSPIAYSLLCLYSLSPPEEPPGSCQGPQNGVCRSEKSLWYREKHQRQVLTFVQSRLIKTHTTLMICTVLNWSSLLISNLWIILTFIMAFEQESVYRLTNSHVIKNCCTAKHRIV